LVGHIPTANYCDPFNPWIKFINLVAEAEENEIAKKKSFLPDIVTGYFIRHDSLLERTLHAIRASVIGCLRQHHSVAFSEHEKKLSGDIFLLKQQVNIAEKSPYAKSARVVELKSNLLRKEKELTRLVSADVDEYCNDYYDEFIAKRNPAPEEKSFANYCTRTVLGYRSPDMLVDLLNAFSKLPEAEKVNLPGLSAYSVFRYQDELSFDFNEVADPFYRL
jgi:hypothetical protein